MLGKWLIVMHRLSFVQCKDTGRRSPNKPDSHPCNLNNFSSVHASVLLHFVYFLFWWKCQRDRLARHNELPSVGAVRITHLGVIFQKADTDQYAWAVCVDLFGASCSHILLTSRQNSHSNIACALLRCPSYHVRACKHMACECTGLERSQLCCRYSLTQIGTCMQIHITLEAPSLPVCHIYQVTHETWASATVA